MANTESSQPVSEIPVRSTVPLKIFFIFLSLAWTLVLFASLWYNLRQVEEHALDSARIQARTAFEKDVMYRRWNSRMGGVFVFVSDSTRPNPYLKNPGRDLSLPDGRMLTKINPAFMTRLVHELGASQSGVLGHITSTNPIRPGNEPDNWERSALSQIERRESLEVSALQSIGDKEYMRFIKGLDTEPSCVPCHPNYTVGEVRGGISVSVPMEPFRITAAASTRTLFGSHLGIWLLGLFGMTFAMKRLAGGLRERDEAEGSLRKLTAELEDRVRQRTESLNRRKGELQAIVENAGLGIFLKDEDGAYVTVNADFAGMLGKTPDQVVGRSDHELLDEATRVGLHAHEQQVLAENKGMELKHAFTGVGGSAYSCFSFPVPEGDRLVGVGGIVVDMTDRDQVEHVLREAKDAAEQASRAKSDFLANMSHEIRTPLNGVIGMADLLLRTRLTQDQASMAAAIKTGGDSLLAVLNDVLDISKIEAGKLALESTPFLLRDVLFDAIKGLTPIANQKSLELILHVSPQVPSQVVGDSMRLRQIVMNLASNALKFTERGEVVLTVLPISRSDSFVRVRFSVTDTGIGIPQDKQTRIFNAFEQADTSTTRRYGGTGLGLAICTRLLRMMHSKLELESHEGMGSSFWFELEFPIDTGAPPLKPLVSVEAIKGRHVLIVDDNETNLRILDETLGSWGIDAHRSMSVDEALALARVAAGSSRPFSLILTDLQMPDKDGVDLLRAVRGDMKLAHLPVILLSSGNLPTELMGESGKPGFFSAVLDKPVRPEILMRAVAAALNIWESYDAQEIERAAEQEEKSAGVQGMKVLLAEDMEMNQLVATRMLKELGHEITVVSNSELALNAVRTQAYDLVFMDIQMPVMDGVQAVRAIRDLESQGVLDRRIPIIAMTANALKGDREKYLAEGMDGYIAKPIILGALRAVIAEVMPAVEAGPTVVDAAPPALDVALAPSVPAAGQPVVQVVAPVAEPWMPEEAHVPLFDAGTAADVPQFEPLSAPELAEGAVCYEGSSAIDREILDRSFAGNEDFIRESIRLYLRDAPNLMREVAEAVERKDGAGLAVASHALKGITGYFTKSGVYESALALEELGRSGLTRENQAAADVLLGALSVGVDCLFTEMREYMKKNNL